MKNIVKELRKWRAHATTLLSLYIPPGRPISEVVSMLRQELAITENIKLKRTRDAVQWALTTAIERLSKLRETPKNGLVVFSGTNESSGENIVLVFSPPDPVPIYFYRTDKEFHTEFLEPMVEESNIYGIIIIERDEATIGLLKPSGIQVVDEIEWFIPGKHHKGGQSQRRFDRIIEQMVEEFYKYVAEKVNSYFVPLIEEGKMKGVIVAGPGYAKHDFIKEADNIDYRVRKLIIGEPIDVAYQGIVGIREVVMKARDTLAKQRFVEVLSAIEEFKYHIAKDDGYTVYGFSDVEAALDNGAVDKILACEENADIDRIEKLASERGAKLIIIPSSVDEYNWFRDAFGCIAAITRYPITT
ncbi:MAG: peptide chain release factor aRF-1 [Sulfolobales archaeon]|nr:peptide chain release factor aRF-1 [Sulfolobales archaeon]MDW8085869.1 peptide chain release factor aRF-1 [Ignisphaera sp.]